MSHLETVENNYVLPRENAISAADVLRNYGSIYRTTGGGDTANRLWSFVRKFVDNRVFDLYLKYLGITTLTPGTLVPIALIFGQQQFKKVFKYMRKKEQDGGSIPVLDGNIIGTFLKLAGLSKLTLSYGTLVPLGLAMAIYEVFSKQKKKLKKKRIQKGGSISKLIFGSSVPPGYLQLGNMYWNGETVQNNLDSPLPAGHQFHRPASYLNYEIQAPCNSGSCAALPNAAHLNKIQIDSSAIHSPHGKARPGPYVIQTGTPPPLATAAKDQYVSGSSQFEVHPDFGYLGSPLSNQMAGGLSRKSRRYRHIHH